MHLSGMRLNDMHLNGMRLSGMHLSDMHLSDMHLNGMRLIGMHLNGLPMERGAAATVGYRLGGLQPHMKRINTLAGMTRAQGVAMGKRAGDGDARAHGHPARQNGPHHVAMCLGVCVIMMT